MLENATNIKLASLGSARRGLGSLNILASVERRWRAPRLFIRRLWFIPHHSFPLFSRRSASDDRSSGGGGSGDIAGAGNVGDLIFVGDRRRVVGRRRRLGDVDGEVEHRDVRRAVRPAALTITAEIHEKYTKGDQRRYK